MQEKTLYLVRLAGCSTCGMNPKITASSSIAGENGFGMMNIKHTDPAWTDLKKKYPNLEEVTAGKKCVAINSDTGKFMECTSDRERVRKLF